MKLQNSKRGFTIVELVIVIAVIAILAAVIISIFSGIVDKANQSNDTQLIRNLNTALATDISETGATSHPTMYSALVAAENQGYNVAKIVAKSKYNIAYDVAKERFVLLDMDENKYLFPKSVAESDSGEVTNKLDYFVVCANEAAMSDVMSKGYSIYYYGDSAPANIVISVGFDAGKSAGIASITYSSESAASVVIRSNSFETLLAVEAPNGTVKHYGFAYITDVHKIAGASYHEYGTVGRLKVAQGHAVVESTGTVFCAMETAETANIENNNGKIYAETTQGGSQNTNVEQKANGVFKDEYHDCGYGHHNMQKLVVDSAHVYEVCTACGYTVMVAGDNEGTPVYHTSANQEATVSDPVVKVDETTKEVTVTNTESAKPVAAGEVEADTDVEKVAACEHTFGEMIEVIPATTETTGVGKYTCTKCGFSYTVGIPKKVIPAKSLDVRDDDGDGIKETLYGFGDYWNDEVVTIPASVTKIAQSVTASSYNYDISKPFKYTSIIPKGEFEATATEIASYSVFYVKVKGSYDNNGTSKNISNGTYPAACEILIFEGALDFSDWDTKKDTTFKETNIKEIRMNNVTVIPDKLFNKASKLEKIEFNSVQSIGAYAFNECKALANITLPEGLTTIGGAAFYGTAIKEIVLPSKLTNCGGSSNGVTVDALFDGMSELESVTFKGTALPNTLTGTVQSGAIMLENVPASIFGTGNKKLKELHFVNGDVATEFMNRHIENYNQDNLTGFSHLEITEKLENNLIIYVSEFSPSINAFWGKGYDFTDGRTNLKNTASDEEKRNFFILEPADKYELDTEYKVICSGFKATNTIIFKLESAE